MMKDVNVWYNYYLTNRTVFLTKGECTDACGEMSVTEGTIFNSGSIDVKDLGVGISKLFTVYNDYSGMIIDNLFFLNKEDAVNHAKNTGYDPETCIISVDVKEREYYPISVPFEVGLRENEKGLYFKQSLNPEEDGIHGRKKVFFKDRACKNNLCIGKAIVTKIKDKGNYGFFEAEMVKYKPFTRQALQSVINANLAYFDVVHLYEDTIIGDVLVVNDIPYVMVEDHADGYAYYILDILRNNYTPKKFLGVMCFNTEDEMPVEKMSEDLLVDTVMRHNGYFSVSELYETPFADILFLEGRFFAYEFGEVRQYIADHNELRSVCTPKEFIGADLVCKKYQGLGYDEFRAKFADFDFYCSEASYSNKFISQLFDSAVYFGFLTLKSVHNVLFVEISDTLLADALHQYTKEEMTELAETVTKINTEANKTITSKARNGKVVVNSYTFHSMKSGKKFEVM